MAQIARTAEASEALVHRYFAGKSGLYLAVAEAGVARLIERQRAADAALGPGAGRRERLECSLHVYLDMVAEWSVGWLTPLRSPGNEPSEVIALRRDARRRYVTLLRELFELPADPALDYALAGYLGFVDEVCVLWAERGHPAADRAIVIDDAIAAVAAALSGRGWHGLT
ncbi:TetR/AcrR family transcriptional regulator [Paractinoplanes lichenicola]|nr:TetR/AcrR family transcriptional regulator [Actinoplanes lichenicola]